MNAITDFFTKYEAVRVDGVPEAAQEEDVSRMWGHADAERDAERQRQRRRETFTEISELVALLEQDVVPLSDDQRSLLREQLDAAWDRLEALG